MTDLVTDVLLPDPQMTKQGLAWACYRTARRAAVGCIRKLRDEARQLDDDMDEAIGDVPLTLYADKAARQGWVARVAFLDLQHDYYVARLVLLRGYQSYIRRVHGAQ